MCAVPLRIVGSGFCPILSQRERRDGARRAPPLGGGRPRAMLALPWTPGVGKTEKSNPRLYFVRVKYPFDMLEITTCCAIIITVITKIYFEE